MFLQYLSKDYRYVTQEELADLDEVLPLTADTENSSDSNNDSRNSSGVGTDHSVIPSSMKNHSNNNIGSISDGVSPLHKRNNRVQERSDGSGEDDSATLLKWRYEETTAEMKWFVQKVDRGRGIDSKRIEKEERIRLYVIVIVVVVVEFLP